MMQVALERNINIIRILSQEGSGKVTACPPQHACLYLLKKHTIGDL